MSEWKHSPPSGTHLQSVPVHQRRGEFSPRHIYIALGAVLGIVATVCALIWHEKGSARSAADAAAVESTIRPIAAPAGTRPPRKPVEKSPALPAAAGDGAWLIGKELKRGTYTTPGAGDRCYWALVSNLPGQLATVVSSAGETGKQTITVGPNVRAFITYGCGKWELIP